MRAARGAERAEGPMPGKRSIVKLAPIRWIKQGQSRLVCAIPHHFALVSVQESGQLAVVGKVACELWAVYPRLHKFPLADLHVPEGKRRLCALEEVTNAAGGFANHRSPFFLLPPPSSQRVPLGIFVPTM